MTIGQNKIHRSDTGSSLRSDTMPSIQLVFSEDEPKRYHVMVEKTHNGSTYVLYGYVVSYLDINDWCFMHGYQLRQVYPGTRFAFPSEKRKLIDLM